MLRTFCGDGLIEGVAPAFGMRWIREGGNEAESAKTMVKPRSFSQQDAKQGPTQPFDIAQLFSCQVMDKNKSGREAKPPPRRTPGMNLSSLLLVSLTAAPTPTMRRATERTKGKRP